LSFGRADRGPRSWSWRRGAALAGVAAIVGAVVVLSSTGRLSPALPTGVCALFASPTGSDASGDGTLAHPFATPGRLDRALSPGQRGCLESGSYGSIATRHRLTRSGAPDARVLLSAAPGSDVTIQGWVDVEASYTTLENVKIDGSNTFYSDHPASLNCPNGVSQPLTIEGHVDVLQYVDYYQSIPSLRSDGLGIGFGGDGDNTIIRYSKIHDVGQCKALDHLIYLSHGNNVEIYDNWMWNDPHGDGVQLYPDPRNARVFDNVIDHAGEGFVIGNEAGDTVTGNQIYNNVILNSTGLPDAGVSGDAIHEYWGGTPGTDNSFHDNIYYDNPGGLGHIAHLTAYNNTNTNPQLQDPTTHNYQPQTTSPTATWNLWNGQPPPAR
jgi:hypothetical protein